MKLMQKITSVTDLKDAIRQLEEEQTESKQLFKEQLQLTVESLKPINLIRSTLDEAFTSSGLIGNLLGATLGQTAGYVSRQAAFGQTRNPIKKIFGSILQTGIAALISTYGETIKETAIIIFKVLFKKKREPDIEPE